MRLITDHPAANDVVLPAPKPTVYRVTLPVRSELHVQASEGEELCVRRSGDVLVIFTRKRAKKP